MTKLHGGLSDVAIEPREPILGVSHFRLPRMERAMTTKELQSQGTVSAVRRFGQIGKGIALAGAIAALSLTTPTPAYAGGNGVGAAIGLGILGGVLAGAAIASTTPPAYGYGPAPGYSY